MVAAGNGGREQRVKAGDELSRSLETFDDALVSRSLRLELGPALGAGRWIRQAEAVSSFALLLSLASFYSFI